ncbi:MAG: dTMP kinase [Desulfurococcaceae archaeon]
MLTESNRRGFFIVLEGIDGSGKTTIANMMIDKLRSTGFNVVYTYEPTDHEIVTLMRTKYNDYRDSFIDALTFALDRLLHLRTKIIPHLMKGFVVISDRYMYSSVAYQSAAGAPAEWVLEVNKWALKPDLAIYLDIEPEIAVMRRKGLHSRFPEFEELEFLRRVRSEYLKMVERGLLMYIDASRPLDSVYNDVEKIVLKTILKNH